MPSTKVDVKEWGGLKPVYVSHLPTSFAVQPKFVQLSDVFKRLFGSEFLDLNDDVIRYELRGFQAWECRSSNCPIETVYLPIVSCGKYHPYVSLKHTSRCVARIMPRIEFLQRRGADYLICLDLTLPHSLELKENHDVTMKKLRRAVNLFLRELHQRLFPKKKSRLGGFYAIHIWKTTRPLDFHYHVHLQLFNVALEENTFHRFAPKLDARTVRIAWRTALVKAGLWEPLEDGLPDVHLHFIRLSDRPRLLNRLHYVYRRPLVDLNTHLTDEQLEQDFNKKWAERIIAYTPRQVFVGFGSRLKALGCVSPKSSAPNCFVCGHPMLRGKKVRVLPPDTPLLSPFSWDKGGGGEKRG